MFQDLAVDLSEAEIALKEATHKFAAEVTRPASLELDKLANPEDVIADGSLLWDVFRRHYELGQHLAGFPEELGGVTLGPLASCVRGEELGWGSADFAIGLGASGMPSARRFSSPRCPGTSSLSTRLFARSWKTGRRSMSDAGRSPSRSMAPTL